MAASPSDHVRDFDFHPGEPFVRVFTVPLSGVLRLDDDTLVSESRIGDVVLRHYAFAGEWFKVNVTFDPAGSLIETAADPDRPAFAFNCDIATPMRHTERDAFAVDLFVDVLVRRDGQTFEIKDQMELEHAVIKGLLSGYEFDSAQSGMERLVGLIEAHGLIPFLDDAHPFGPSSAPEGRPMTRIPLADVPEVQPEHRWTWHPPV